jgi:hypothetical protein
VSYLPSYTPARRKFSIDQCLSGRPLAQYTTVLVDVEEVRALVRGANLGGLIVASLEERMQATLGRVLSR